MRHHGGVAETCIHGYAPGTCLICQTLDAGKAGNGADTKSTLAKGKVPKAATARRKAQLATTTDAGVLAQSGPRVVPPEAPAERSGLSLRLGGVVVAVIAVLVLGWALLHVVLAVVHILELFGIALLAGYIGWRAGVYHGRRTPRGGGKG
jgi:hypothetical protein